MSVSISKLAKLVDGQLVLPDANTVELKITSASTLETATGGGLSWSMRVCYGDSKYFS